MIYLLLANLVMLVHLAFVLFVVFGGFLLLHRREWLWLHLPVFLWGVWVALTPVVCPLTPLEQGLLVRAGRDGYDGGFIAHYLGRLVDPELDVPNFGLLLGVAALSWNAAVYAFVYWRRTRRGA